VLDNCEHVLDGAARLAEAVAQGCPDVGVLATSRERLNVAGEQLMPVGPLDPAGPAVDLFHARALALDPTFDQARHRDDVEEICRRLDGIPLAIELAAGQTRSFTPADLRLRLDDRLRLLIGGRRTGPARQQTMRAAIQWSYDLLGPAERDLLERLSVFAGPFDLTAAEAVGATGSVDTTLAGLVERSMVIAAAGPFGRRFRLLDPVRHFAAELLAQHEPAGRFAERHARWCARQVADIHRYLTGPAEAEGVARLAELWPHLRAAVAWACATQDWALADALVRPVAMELPMRGRQEIGEWAESIIAVTPEQNDGLRAFWWVWAVERRMQNGDRDVQPNGDHPLARYARAYLSGDMQGVRQSLPAATAELDRWEERHLARFLVLMSAGSWLGTGQFHEVDAAIGALLERYRSHGPPTLLHWCLQTLAYSAAFQQRPEDADRLLDEAAAVAVPAGTLSADQLVQARSAFRRGERARAIELMLAYVDQQLDTHNVVAASVVSIDFITMMARLDRLDEAAHMLGYLEEINEFGALAARTLVADAATRIAASTNGATEATRAAGRRLDDRAALAYMRDVLRVDPGLCRSYRG
jgi:predicted ATPase